MRCCVFVTMYSGWNIRLFRLQMITLDKLIKKELLERFYRFKDQNMRRDSLYRYISVSSRVEDKTTIYKVKLLFVDILQYKSITDTTTIHPPPHPHSPNPLPHPPTGDRRVRQLWPHSLSWIFHDRRCASFHFACADNTPTALRYSAVWLCGCMAVRLCVFAALRLYGSTALRLCGSAALRLCGSAALRLCGSAALRLCGSAALRLCGSAALRLCGSAALRLCGSAAPCSTAT